ncbi:MAG: hypothetical protein IJM18_05205 [Clostridia bacterium]|nr:hypothetical protein [Clostridia bacterium]
MKKRSLSFLAAALALVLAFTALPSFPARANTVEPCWTVPAGYNANDYDRCASFLEQTDESGVKNGEKLSENYDPNDPDTWGTYEAVIWNYDGSYEIFDAPRFDWLEAGGELRISYICLDDQEYDEDFGVVGTLDLSGCSELIEVTCIDNFIEALDLSGCTGLFSVLCTSNLLTELDVSCCPQLTGLLCENNNLTELDVSNNPDLYTLMCALNGIAELDLSNNTSLSTLIVYGNALTELDVSCLPELMYLDCDDNRLAELDVSNNPQLEVLNCCWNELDELDVSNNPLLTDFYCFGNHLTELDVSNNLDLHYFDCSANLITELDLSEHSALEYFCCTENPMRELILPEAYPVRTLNAEGSGYVGCAAIGTGDFTACAEPEIGAAFLGWFDEAGALVSGEEAFQVENASYDVLTARFEDVGILPGDVDNSGDVTVSDAILALRAAMQLLELDEAGTAAADMDGSGSITVSDAIMILRTAMGIAG